MRVIEIVLIWWCFWMIVEGVSMYRSWPEYMRIYRLAKVRCPLWLSVVVYLPISPVMKIWEVFKPLFVLPQYKVQIEIFRYDGRNAKVQSDAMRMSDGGEIAAKLMEGDSTISAIYYQVVTIHDEGVIEAETKR